MKRIVLLVSMVLAACAGPTVDRDTASFDETKYASDLNECRGGNAVTFALCGLGGAVIGAAFGATEGVTAGAIHGDAGDGALYGAIAGSVLGLGVGAYKAYEERDNDLRQCLASKGWKLEPA
jgi:outer membrane lipoprotein SlyB